MVSQIGGSTSPLTAGLRRDIDGPEPASLRYFNPGAQYPSAEAAKFGQLGYGIIGGGHKIARFPSPVNGAASNFDLLNRKYTGKTIGDAGRIWTGANGFGVPGYDPGKLLTAEMLNDPAQAIALLKAIAGRESGRGNNLTEEQWRQAHAMFKAGSADAYLSSLSDTDAPGAVSGTATGAGLLKRAREHIGEEYRNIQVPKNDPNWKGPWDCAEFVSWLVFQEANKLFGCIDDSADPAKADAYTGAWKLDLDKYGIRVSVAEAAGTPGGIVLRHPPNSGSMGHIAICDGQGGTVEAKGRRYGVVADTVHGRPWDAGILVPGISYGKTSAVDVAPATDSYKLGAQGLNTKIVRKIQQTLLERGFNPGTLDGEYGPDTQAAVVAFQSVEGLVVDGIVGPETAAALGISFDDGSPIQSEDGKGMADIISILEVLKRIFETQGKTEGGAMPAPAVNPISTFEQLAKIMQALQQQTPSTGTTTTDPSLENLRKVVELILPILNPKLVPEKQAPLGQVNGALGEGIGELINGKKTAIGTIGSLLVSLLPVITQFVPSLAGVSAAGPVALPIFLALAGWGVLGKFEKWTQRIAAAKN